MHTLLAYYVCMYVGVWSVGTIPIGGIVRHVTGGITCFKLQYTNIPNTFNTYKMNEETMYLKTIWK